MALYFLIGEKFVEPANGALTSFTLTKRIADTVKLQVWSGEPGVKQAVVQVPPGPNQVQVTGDFQVEFGTAPVYDGFVNYLTDEAQTVYDLILEERLKATGDPLVWTYAKPPIDVDSFQLISGIPGTVRIKVVASPNPNQYTNDPAMMAITFGDFGQPRPGDPAPTATYFSSLASAPARNSCTRPN